MPRNEEHIARSAQSAQPLEEAFRAFLDRYKLNQKFDETYLLVHWEKIMGLPIAKRTTQLHVHKKVLFVTVNSAPLKQELIHSKQTILRLFEKEVGAGVIEDIVIR
jgi:predicted nucleic acid-binding Zn ribbon protein